MITTTLITNFPRKLVYLARKYARGIPKRARNRVEIDAEIILRTKASQSSSLVRLASNFVGSPKVSIEASGNTIYVILIPDKISIIVLKP
jgi:hypothetical protein